MSWFPRFFGKELQLIYIFLLNIKKLGTSFSKRTIQVIQNSSLVVYLARSQSTVPLSTTHSGSEPHGTDRGAWPIAALMDSSQ